MVTDLIVPLVTLTFLEIVLGVDNVIFISILSGKLPPAQQKRARRVGLIAAMGMRLALLWSIVWIARLTQPLFTLLEHGVSGRDLILLGGGLFLLAKATYEIHDKLEGEAHESGRAASSFASVIGQVMVLDIVFSLDSVITAIGMADNVAVMATAVVLAVLVMLVAAEPISAVVERHPTLKILALSFLLLIGLSLIADGLGQHISKGYIYFAMGFSVFVEAINLRVRKGRAPVHLHRKYEE
jgi:predicted tellurium resistance membrane protein TerC